MCGGQGLRGGGVWGAGAGTTLMISNDFCCHEIYLSGKTDLIITLTA